MDGPRKAVVHIAWLHDEVLELVHGAEFEPHLAGLDIKRLFLEAVVLPREPLPLVDVQ
jgi:hypothetical protein